MRCPVCGPKCSTFYTIIGLWGVIMLALLGVFFHIKTPNLFEDVSFDEDEWAKKNYAPDFIGDAYEKNAVNCWIAAALYFVVFLFSVIQQRLNARSTYEQA